MTGTYIAADGTKRELGSLKNVAILKKIVSKEVFADITSIVHGCLDADMMCDSDFVISPDEFLNSADMRECPYCSAIITSKNLIDEEEMNLYLKTVKIDKDEYSPEEPYMCPVCGVMHATESGARCCCAESVVYRCPTCKAPVLEDDLNDLSVPVDAQQWLVVSKWLGKCLAEVGERILLTDEGAYLWAREHSSPDPEEDQAIATICAAVGVLEGQSNYKESKS